MAYITFYINLTLVESEKNQNKVIVSLKYNTVSQLLFCYYQGFVNFCNTHRAICLIILQIKYKRTLSYQFNDEFSIKL